MSQNYQPHDNALTHLATALEAVLGPAQEHGHCTGYEIADADYRHREYVVKIGIYPWGMTFLQGRLGDILAGVRQILQNIQDERVRCPVCGKAQPLAPFTMEWDPWPCGCGVQFFPNGDQLTEAIEQQLSSSVDAAPITAFRHYLTQGWNPVDLIIGLDQVMNHEVPVYRLVPHATLRTYAQLPWPLVIDEALTHLAFHRMFDPDQDGSCLYEGNLLDQKVVMQINPEEWDSPIIMVWPDWSIDQSLGSDLTDSNDPNGDQLAQRAEAWYDFLYSPDNPDSVPWTIADALVDDNHYWIAARLTDLQRIPHSLDGAVESLLMLLPMAHYMTQEAVQRFLQLHLR